MSLLAALGLAGVLIQSPAAAPAAAVAGRVVEEGSRMPIAGAQVVLFPMRPGPVAPPFRDRPQTAVTDQDGRYRFENVEPGRYGLSAQKAGYALPIGSGLQGVDLRAGERRDDVDVSLQKGGVIVGRVLDESGEPLVAAQVVAMQKPPASSPMASTRAGVLIPAGNGAQTNDLGEFRLFGLPPGEYYVQAMSRFHFDGSPGPRATTILPTYFPGTSDPLAAQPITVASDQTSGDVAIRMVSAPAFQVSGVVLDEAGRPLANAMVRLNADQPAGSTAFMMGGPWSDSRTDASGRFTLNNVTNGAYTLLAIAPVVLAGPGNSPGRTAAATGGGFTSFAVTGGANGGVIGGGVFTETTGSTTIQYRDDMATRVPISVHDSNVNGLEVIVRSPRR